MHLYVIRGNFMNFGIDNDLTEKIIGAAFEVHTILGSGFLEKVYENSLYEELSGRNLLVERQKPIAVYYKGKVVGEYFADIIVDGKIIVELKVVDKIIDIHEIQLKNYLKATALEIGLLINFGKSVEVKRKFVPNIYRID